MTENTQNMNLNQDVQPMADAQLDSVSGGAKTVSTSYCPYCAGTEFGVTLVRTTEGSVIYAHCKSCDKYFPRSKLVVIRTYIDDDIHVNTGNF